MTQSDSRSTSTVLAAIAGGASVGDAAREAGVSRSTASRIVNSPAGQAALAQLRAASLDHAAARLVGLVDLAADTLQAVMSDDDAAAAARVGAARAVLTQALAIREATVTETRLAALGTALSQPITTGRHR